MSSGGGGSVKYSQSPEQAALGQAVLPFVQGLGQYGTQRYFNGAPNLGAPSATGTLTSVPMYGIPSPSTAMPTQDWWSSLAPQVKQGLYAPYEEAGRGLLETLGARGQSGSAMGGYSGAAGAALGELAGQAANNVGLAAWQMTSPAAYANWDAQLNRNALGYNQALQEQSLNYNTALQAWQYPMSILGQSAYGLPQGYYQPNTGGFGSALSGGLMGGLAGYNITGSPYGGLAGGLLGGLSGYFS